MASDPIREFTAEQLLGPMNDFEKRNAPARIWASGDVELLRESPRVSVVGSRRASELGIKRAQRIARELAQSGAIVLSGLAEGIDSAAHRSCISARGRTIAVIGTPLDTCFPASNAELQAEIAEHHLLLSQFAPGSNVQRGNFPMRNKLMALIADATVIVEAQDGSGTMHQAWEAIRLGRKLFVMQSNFDSPDLHWPTELRDYGAEVLVDMQQVLDVLPTRPLTLEDAPF